MKTAIVTGATKGIGKAIAIRLLERGYFVFCTYGHDEAAAQQAQIDFEAASKRFEIIRVDQSQASEIHAFTDRILSYDVKLDCIICNAGATVRKPANAITDQEWEQTLMVGLNSHYYLIRDLWDRINPASRIVFIGSMMGVMPHSTSLIYGVMKSAVHALARNLVKAFEGTDTTVNVIAPGFVETEWQHNKPQEIRDSICRKTAIHRFASTDEITGTVDYILDNGFVNGAVLEVSGGYCYQ